MLYVRRVHSLPTRHALSQYTRQAWEERPPGQTRRARLTDVAAQPPTLVLLLILLCSFSPRNFPGKNTGVGCHFLLQGIFLIQGSNPGLPHCKQILYSLSHQGSTKRRYKKQYVNFPSHTHKPTHSWAHVWTLVPQTWTAGPSAGRPPPHPVDKTQK